jgi:hypothetical protein
LSEDSEGSGAASSAESKSTGARGKTAGADSVPGDNMPDDGTPPDGMTADGTPASDEGTGTRPVPKPRAGQPPEGEDDEHAELERLRAEVRDLRGDSGAGGSPAEPDQAVRRKGRWRAPVSALLIVLGCVLAPVSVLGVWAANQVSDTNRYVANMAPLISDPAIQHALSARITTEITSRLDVQSTVTQAAAQAQANNMTRLATLLHTFAGQIASGVNSAVATAVARVVASPEMATVWTQANRVAHQGIVRVLSGQGGGAVNVVNGQVVLSLGPLITQAKEQLSARGLTAVDKLPTINATYPLFAAPNLEKAQQGYRLITTLRWLLPFLSLALLALGVYVARRHRRALIGAALGLSASMLVLGIALTIARVIYLNSIPSTMSSDAAAALYDTLIRFIRQGLRVILVVGLIIAAAAFLTGPSAIAVRSRHGAKSGIDWLRTRGERAGVHTGPVGEWTGAHKGVLRAGAVALFALIFVFWGHPTVAVVIWLAVLLLVVLGLIELIGGGRSAGSPQAGPPRAGPPAAAQR